MVTVHGDGKAGQYAKSKASRTLHRHVLVTGLLVGVGGVVLGSFATILSIGWLARHLGQHAVTVAGWAGLAIIVAAIAYPFLSARFFARADAEMTRERLKWLRGGQAEALVAWRLRDCLDGDWHLFNNLEMPDRGDIDHVLIGPGGLFCISTKGSRGMYSLAANGTHLLNLRGTDHLAQAQQLAMQLQRRLATFCGNVPWVQPVLAAPFAYVDFAPKQNNVWVLHEDGSAKRSGVMVKWRRRPGLGRERERRHGPAGPDRP